MCVCSLSDDFIPSTRECGFLPPSAPLLAFFPVASGSLPLLCAFNSREMCYGKPKIAAAKKPRGDHRVPQGAVNFKYLSTSP